MLLFAAASTIDAVEEVCTQFATHENVKVQTSFAGSSTLATQILNGAQADLFLSASLDWVDELKRRGMVHRSWAALGNQLVCIRAANSKPVNGNQSDVASLEDLLDDRVKRIAIADPDTVPAGIYAKHALTKLGIWQQVSKKCVYAAHVRQTLSQVESGAVDFGIVYKTDAGISPTVEVVFEISHDLSGPIRYGLVLTQHGQLNDKAVELFEMMCSDSSKQTFQKYGFVVGVDVH